MILDLLNNLLWGSFTWYSATEDACNNTKTALVNTVILGFLAEHDIYDVYTDASNKGLGAF